MKQLYCLALFVIVNIFSKHLTTAQTAADPPVVAVPISAPLVAAPPSSPPLEPTAAPTVPPDQTTTIDNSKIVKYLLDNVNDHNENAPTGQNLVDQSHLTTPGAIKLNPFGFKMPSFVDRLNKPEPTEKPTPQVTTTRESVNKADEEHPQRPFYGNSIDENDIENELAESGTLFRHYDKLTTKAATTEETTAAPTTRRVTTAAPTTAAPTTQAPKRPVYGADDNGFGLKDLLNPSTAAPTTRRVTTAAPTTAAPTTRRVTTAAPTTEAPKPQRPAYDADGNDSATTASAAITTEGSTQSPIEGLNAFFKNLNFPEGSLLKQNNVNQAKY